MNHAHDDTDPVEHDPTGMRALLAGLPDPGPMPGDLVDRIRAELAEEQRRREAPAADDREQQPEGPVRATVVPLRPRRSGVRLLAAAAAVVGVLGLGGLLVDATRSGGAIASLTAGGSADSGAAAGGEAMPEKQSDDLGAPEVRAASGDGRTVVLDGADAVRRADLAAAAAALPTGPFRTRASAPQSGADGSGVPVATVDGARACATGLGVPPEDEVVVRLTVVDGEPAALLVATTSGGARTAWAVARTCSTQEPAVVAGPVSVG